MKKRLFCFDISKLNHHFFFTWVLTLAYLQQPFDIETHAFDYAIGEVVTQQGHLVAYHSDTLSDTVWRYPTYYKEIYCIVKAQLQWKHYIMGKESTIHTDQRPLQFIQTQGKSQNDCHKKWPTYIKKFHFNIKYKKCSTNNVSGCLVRPLVREIITMVEYYGCDTSMWMHIYKSNPKFSSTYQTLWKVREFQISTSKMQCYATQDIYVFLKVSFLGWFRRPTIVESMDISD